MKARSSSFVVAVVLSLPVLAWAQNSGSSDMHPVPMTPALKPSTSTSYKFIVAGDNRPAKAGDHQPKITQTILSAAKADGVNFIVWTGDTIVGLDSADPTGIGTQYSEFFALAATAGVPVFTAPGNHEMDVKVKGKDKDKDQLKEIGSEAMEKLYRHNMSLPDGAPIYGGFSYSNARFVLLNSEERPPANVVRSAPAVTDNKVNLDPGYVSQKQMDWLTKELAADKATTHVFVFMHHPVMPKTTSMGLNASNAAELMKMFGQYPNIDYVFASHEHLYWNPQSKDTSSPPDRKARSSPPIYLVSGGAGAPLDNRAFYNYLVVTVNGTSVQVEMKNLGN